MHAKFILKCKIPSALGLRQLALTAGTITKPGWGEASRLPHGLRLSHSLWYPKMLAMPLDYSRALHTVAFHIHSTLTELAKNNEL
jgi:hypothetical protein